MIVCLYGEKKERIVRGCMNVCRCGCVIKRGKPNQQQQQKLWWNVPDTQIHMKKRKLDIHNIVKGKIGHDCLDVLE